jgi:hypothetical protein
MRHPTELVVAGNTAKNFRWMDKDPSDRCPTTRPPSDPLRPQSPSPLTERAETYATS